MILTNGVEPMNPCKWCHYLEWCIEVNPHLAESYCTEKAEHELNNHPGCYDQGTSNVHGKLVCSG